MGVILQCESYDAIKSIVKDMLTLANYRMIHDDLPVGKAMKNIDALIQTHDTEFLSDTENECEEKVVERGEEGNADSIKWFDEILDEIQRDLGEKAIPNRGKLNKSTNWYYFPEINKFLRHHLSRLPLWSSVMRKIFNADALTGISTDIESRFGMIKNNVCKSIKLPARADVFVKQLVNEVNGVAKLNKLIIGTCNEQDDNAHNKDIHSSMEIEVNLHFN